jgi:hypothetical protein
MNWAPVCDVGFYVPSSQYYVHNRIFPPHFQANAWSMEIRVSDPLLRVAFDY